MSTRDVPAAPPRVPAEAVQGGDGIVLGTGGAVVDLYVDFLCPYCRMFEEQHGPALDEAVDAGTITVIYHPVGFLDRLSTTGYSTRAAAASGCAADAGRFREYLYTLFANQPPEGGDGLSDEELVRLGMRVGCDDGFGRCVQEGAYRDWAQYVSGVAVARGVHGIPTAYVEGVGVPASSRAILAAARG